MAGTTTQNIHRFYRLAGAATAKAGPRALFRRFLENWLSQAAMARLARLDDALLRDAGLSRRDIEWARQLPMTVDAEKALLDRIGAGSEKADSGLSPEFRANPSSSWLLRAPPCRRHSGPAGQA